MDNDKSFYDINQIVLLCRQCGAPLDAPANATAIKCGYCGVTTIIEHERKEVKPEQAAHSAEVTEEKRLADLKTQDGRVIMPPLPILGMMKAGGLNPEKLSEAESLWKTMRQVLEAGPDEKAEKELFFLVLIIGQYYRIAHDYLRSRAYYETALQLVRNPDHLHDLYCLMSQTAANEGDLESAEKWLAYANPRPTGIHQDSAYRYSKALIATRKGDWSKVLEYLGADIKDIPISNSYDDLCGVFRANAHEKSGKLEQAKDQLEKAALQNIHSLENVARVMEVDKTLDLCSIVKHEVLEKARSKRRKKRWIRLAIAVLVIGAIAAFCIACK